MTTEQNVLEAVVTIQKYLERYKNDKTVDGPYIQVGVDYVCVVDCYGASTEGQAIEEVLDGIDVLK